MRSEQVEHETRRRNLLRSNEVRLEIMNDLCDFTFEGREIESTNMSSKA